MTPRLAVLYLVSRRVPAAFAAVIALGAALRVALIWDWDSYGALQLPFVLETGCATVIAAAIASPFGDPERATGRRLPVLRLCATLALTCGTAVALTAAGTGAHLVGGFLDAARNLVGGTGIGLACAVVLGGGMAWTGPAAYLLIGTYSLYAVWHGGAASGPWIWPARPPEDLGAWLCAGLVFAAGLALSTVRGARGHAAD